MYDLQLFVSMTKHSPTTIAKKTS